METEVGCNAFVIGFGFDCLVFRLSLKQMERVKGIEPSCEAWKASVLPLNYTRLLVEPKPGGRRLTRGKY
jgi:hypothetical protein